MNVSEIVLPKIGDTWLGLDAAKERIERFCQQMSSALPVVLTGERYSWADSDNDGAGGYVVVRTTVGWVALHVAETATALAGPCTELVGLLERAGDAMLSVANFDPVFRHESWFLTGFLDLIKDVNAELADKVRFLLALRSPQIGVVIDRVHALKDLLLRGRDPFDETVA